MSSLKQQIKDYIVNTENNKQGKKELIELARTSGEFKGLLTALRGSDVEIIKKVMLNALVEGLTPKPLKKRIKRKETGVLPNTAQANKLKSNTNIKDSSKMKLRIKNTSEKKAVINTKTASKKQVKNSPIAAKNQVQMKSKMTVSKPTMDASEQIKMLLEMDSKSLQFVAYFDPRFKDVDIDRTEGEVRVQMCQVVMGLNITETIEPEKEEIVEQKTTLSIAANEVEAPVRPKRAKKKTQVKGKKSKAQVMLDYILEQDGEWFSIDEVADHVTEVCGEGSTPTANKGGAGSFITSKLPQRGYVIVKEEFEEGIFYAVEETPES